MPSAAAARRSGPDACPGVRSVWEAADGGLARVRLPGGRLTPAQLRVLTDAAAELGSGVLELTLRANVQVRGLAGGGEQALAARLRPAGLLRSDTHDRVRNLLASPLHGLGPRPDLTDLLAALDDALCDDEALAALPGRFLFAVDDGADDVAGAGADVTLVATDVAGATAAAPGAAASAAAPRWTLLLAGVAVGTVADANAAVDVAIAAARGFLEERDAQCSPAWRLAELADGPQRVSDRLRRSSLSPLAAPSHPVADVHPTPDVRAEGRDRGAGSAGPGATPGPFSRADGGIGLVVGVPEGRLDVPMARLLLRAAAPDDVLRVTPWRSVVLPTAPDEDCVAALRTGGFVVEA